jgi:aspartate kinase
VYNTLKLNVPAEDAMPQKIKVGGVMKSDCLASISVLAVKDQPGIAAAILDALGQRRINVLFVVQVIDHHQQDQMVLCVDRDDLSASLAAIESTRPSVQPEAIIANSQVASVAIYGPDFKERPGIAGQMFRALAEHGVNILAISTSISTVTCIIQLSKLKDARAAIDEYFEQP